MAITKAEIERVRSNLYLWMKQNGFQGYDPYDGINTENPFIIKTALTRLLATYVHKFSPINLRKILGVKKTKDNQGVALVLESVIKWGKRDETALMSEMVEFILSNSLIDKYGHHCWNGHNFPIHNTGGYQSTDMPGIVGTVACGNAILEYYNNIEQSQELRNVLLSIRDFLTEELLIDHRNGNVHFRYHPDSPKYSCTYNASMVAAAFVEKINTRFGDEKASNLVRKSVDFVAENQKPNGSWGYSLNLKTGKEKKQIDFHQGFILDQFFDLIQMSKDFSEYLPVYKKGLASYRNEQFLPNGQGFYRYPKKWPANIHNQAQGIITFSKASKYDKKYCDHAKKIAEWTVNNMLDAEGFFYYTKYSSLTNRIPYMRWSQAWMLLALIDLLDNCY